MTMFGDIFMTNEELLEGEGGGQLLTNWERLPRNCADKIPLPEIPRKVGYPIGLKNQGATCYLNSLFQVLFHTPELRQIILQLPLCLDNAQTPSEFVSKAKQSFLLGLQRLFSEMSLCDQKSVGTEYINKAFGWEGAQHTEQQDIQQAMRVIFDTIQRALFGTNFHQPIQSLFKGITTRYKTCTVCGQTSDRPEEFNDLILQVKNIKSVEQALKLLTTPQSMEGDNAIFCDTCQLKQNMWLGNRIQQLPGTLVLTLNRFDFDYETFERVKLNTCFEFNLQLDLKGYLMPHPDPDYYLYELYGVVIHRGTAQGGHYTCYVRDLKQQTNWKAGLQQAEAQEAKIKKGSEPKEKSKKQKDAQQQKEYKLAEPSNKSLLENWYQINDNIATAINAEKITTKYEGSESAYILFYRRKSLPVPKDTTSVAEYFRNSIIEANKVMQKERDIYEQQKNHMIIIIQGEQHRLKTSMTMNEFKDTFIPAGHSLVMESLHNGLPYYPMQLYNHPDKPYQPEDTLFSLEVPHQVNWKKYNINSPQYKDISGSIGKERLPMELVLIIDGDSPKRIIAHSDQNFLMLRMKIQKLLNVPYEHQLITLITPHKPVILTQKITNDDIILPKLNVYHGSQLQIKSGGGEQDDGPKEEEKKEKDLMICFVIERDDVIGLKRFYYQKTKTLDELFVYFHSIQGIDDGRKRRFRNLSDNRLLYSDVYENTLEDINFSQEIVRLRLERGEIPIKGDILVKIKNQSTLMKKENQDEEVPNVEKIFDPNTPIKQVKEWACQSYSLQPQLHKLYLTDWVTQPIRSLNRQHLTLFEANFSRQDTICLRDIYSPIGQELVHLQVFSTLTGSPQNTNKEGIHVKIEQFKTVQDLKQLLIETLELKDTTPDKLRLRQIKRDYMFGSIWRDSSKTVKTVTVNSTKVVYQILEQPEHLTDEQIVLILKSRNKEKRVYEGGIQVIFKAGKVPSVQELTKTVKQKLSIEEEILLIKYFHYNFEWVEISKTNIEDLIKNKKKSQQKNKGDKGKKGQPKANKKEEDKPKKQEQKEKNKEQKEEEAKEKIKTENPKVQQKKQQNKGEGNEQKGKKEKKGGQQKGNKGEQQQKQLLQECQNLRKAPILLKDGDIIGWGLAADLQGDDLQTDEDLALRVHVKAQSAKHKGKEKGGFVLGVGF